MLGTRARFAAGAKRLRTATITRARRLALKPSDGLVFLVGLVVAGAVAAVVAQRERSEALVAFERRSRLAAEALRAGVSPPVETLASVAAFLSASPGASESEFDAFARRALDRHPALYAFEWAPRVEAAERDAFVAEARRAHRTYELWRLGSNGTREPVPPGQLVTPLRFMVPPLESVLGLDIWSQAVNRPAIARARDTGEAAAGTKFRLVEDLDGSPESVAVYQAVYASGSAPSDPAARVTALRGYVLVLFRVAPLADRALRELDLAGLDIVLRERAGDAQAFYESRPGAATERARPDRVRSWDVRCADAVWTLEATFRPEPFLSAARVPGAIVAGGGLLAALVVLGLARARVATRLKQEIEEARKLGPYSLLRPIGKGSMGVVWEAKHALLRRPAAIKLLPPDGTGNEALARFEREIRLMTRLTHPNTVSVFDVGRTPEGELYYVMELLDGLDLATVVERDSPMPPERVAYLLRQACGALSEAHDGGLIHRDVKPANIMTCRLGGLPDFVKVLDYGVAKDVVTHATDVTVTHTGALIGTPLFLAPEGISAPHDVDARLDLFALGAVGYFLLTGAPPFPGRNVVDIYARQIAGPPELPSGRAGRPVPPGLERLLLDCLALDRGRRPASARELEERLAGFAEPWTEARAASWWTQRGDAILTAVRRTVVS